MMTFNEWRLLNEQQNMCVGVNYDLLKMYQNYTSNPQDIQQKISSGDKHAASMQMAMDIKNRKATWSNVGGVARLCYTDQAAYDNIVRIKQQLEMQI